MASPSRKTGWIWFFLFLALMGGLAIAIPLVYNVQQQLRPEQLSAARRLWQEKAPADYDLEYQVRRQSDEDSEKQEPEFENYHMEVRNGRIVSILNKVTGDVLTSKELIVTKDFFTDGLFDLMELNLEADSKSTGIRNFSHAQFDKSDGHPTIYVHRIMGSRQRLQIIVQLTRVEDDGTEDRKSPPN
jgi:hypothetical protein